jgi:hypothetical protein
LPNEAVHSREQLAKKRESITTAISGLENERSRINEGLLGINEGGERPEKETSIPVLSISRRFADDILSQANQPSIDALEQELDAKQSPASRSLDRCSAEVDVELKAAEQVSSNVLAVIPGRGALAEETVVIGAHYDHVGWGGFGSLAPGTHAIHNGADDNASGTSMMLALAGMVRSRLANVASHRRVLMIAFTGEERGLLGSLEYVRRPRFSLASTVAMINLDMVGRLKDNELMVYGIGSGDTLDGIVEQANTAHRFQLYKVGSGYGPSDHQSFYEAGVPVLFFFTGLHSDYHRPSDDIERIEQDGMVRVTEMVCDVSLQLVTNAQRPTRVQTDKQASIRRQLTGYLGVTLATRGGGVALASVSPGGPAELAGLLPGDYVRAIGKNTIRSASDVLETLRYHSPGDTIVITTERSGQRLEQRVQLTSRPQ